MTLLFLCCFYEIDNVKGLSVNFALCITATLHKPPPGHTLKQASNTSLHHKSPNRQLPGSHQPEPDICVHVLIEVCSPRNEQIPFLCKDIFLFLYLKVYTHVYFEMSLM